MKLPNVVWAWRVLRSKTFVVLTDTNAAVYLPLANPDEFSDLMMLKQQRAVFTLFTDEFKKIEKAHNDAVKLLLHKEKNGKARTTKRTRKV
jgi:hypothetical protein